jgi:hypothetical protein
MYLGPSLIWDKIRPSVNAKWALSIHLLLYDAGRLVPRGFFPRKHCPPLCAFEEGHPKVAAAGRFRDSGFSARDAIFQP